MEWGGPPECTGDPRPLADGKRGAVCGQRWGDGPVLSCPGPPPSLRNIRGRGDVQYPLLYQNLEMASHLPNFSSERLGL